jgi:hypothetical protein
LLPPIFLNEVKLLFLFAKRFSYLKYYIEMATSIPKYSLVKDTEGNNMKNENGLSLMYDETS